jgi:plastocyanin
MTLVLGLAACGDDDDDGGAVSGDVTTTAPADTGGGGGGDSAGASADVSMSNFAFDPDQVTVSAGGEITISNEDSTTHTFTSDDGGFDVQVSGGEQGSATAPDEAGDYEFHCTIHPNMTGTLTVQ